MMWFILALMSLVAIGFAVGPMLKDMPRLTVLAGIAIVGISVTSTGVYYVTGSPGVPSGASSSEPEAGEISEMVAALAARLEKEPDDLNGWRMLGRTHMTLGNFADAVTAFERAVSLESAQNAQTLVELGVALAQSGGQTLSPRAISTFENAITLDPNHPEALFYSGIGAFNRGNPALAADRWEQLLETDPPEEIRALLRERIAVWRGESPPPVAVEQPEATAGRPAPVTVEQPEATAGRPAAVVSASISVTDDALRSLPVDATVYVIARDPAQPAPPIAVTRRRLSELPSVIELGDRDSMVPGRSLSGFAEFELLARVSVSGSPAAQAGDWFGSVIVRPADQNEIDLAISEQVP